MLVYDEEAHLNNNKFTKLQYIDSLQSIQCDRQNEMRKFYTMPKRMKRMKENAMGRIACVKMTFWCFTTKIQRNSYFLFRADKLQGFH